MSKITKFLLFSAVFLVPSYLIRFIVFGIPTNILEILIYLTFISFLLEKPRIDWKKLYKNYKLCIFPIALIFLGLILSTLINKNYQAGFGIIKGWFLDPLLFSFILIQKIKEKKEVENILKIFYFSAFATSLAALGYFFFGFLTYDGRLKAFYLSPNHLAMFLAPAIFVGIYFSRIKNQELRINNFVMIFYNSLIVLAVYLTYSYATWTAIVLSLLIVLLIEKSFSKKFALISVLIFFIAFLTQLNNPKLKDFFSERSSLNSRVMVWKSSVRMLQDNFIFGIGPENFQNKYLERQKYFPPYLEWAVPEPHNLYLAFWLQSGIIGLVGFVSLVTIWLKQALKNSVDSLRAVFLGIIFYILIHGIADTPYWKNDLSFIFWMIFSLALIALEIDSVKFSVGSVNEKKDILGRR
ncbi:MAG: O-antigen ligase family protein [bacterium]|nr:O-antigen ligase family protein [bacterium]